MRIGLFIIAALFPIFAFALESLPFKSPEDCGEWKSNVTKWFQDNKVKMVGDDMEVKITCVPQSNTGYILSRLTETRAEELSERAVNFDCSVPGGKASQRTVASVTPMLDTPCKNAANDIKLFQKQIVAPPLIKTGGLDWYCCNGAENNKTMGQFACKSLLGCLSCPLCLSHSSSGGWR